MNAVQSRQLTLEHGVPGNTLTFSWMELEAYLLPNPHFSVSLIYASPISSESPPLPCNRENSGSIHLLLPGKNLLLL